MKIEDTIFEGCFVELEPTDQGYHICELSGVIDIKHGIFTACSYSVPLLKINDFIKAFEEFCTNRKIEPKLEGVYDTYFHFYARVDKFGREVILMEFSIGDATVYPFIYNLKGLFEIDSHKLPSILSNFKELAKMSY